MGRAVTFLICAALAACAARQAFTDGDARDVEELQRHVEQRAARLLAPGERLSIEINDLDRAGSVESWRPERVRMVRDVYPARIELGFRLSGAQGALVKQGTLTLRGLPVAAAAAYGNDPLRYERALLDDWLERVMASRADR